MSATTRHHEGEYNDTSVSNTYPEGDTTAQDYSRSDNNNDSSLRTQDNASYSNNNPTHRADNVDAVQFAPVTNTVSNADPDSINPSSTVHSHGSEHTSGHDNEHEHQRAHHRRGSHGSQGKGEGGIKGVLHKLKDKVHPYDTNVEKGSFGKGTSGENHGVGGDGVLTEEELRQEKKERRRSNGGYV